MHSTQKCAIGVISFESNQSTFGEDVQFYFTIRILKVDMKEVSKSFPYNSPLSTIAFLHAAVRDSESGSKDSML